MNDLSGVKESQSTSLIEPNRNLMQKQFTRTVYANLDLNRKFYSNQHGQKQEKQIFGIATLASDSMQKVINN